MIYFNIFASILLLNGGWSTSANPFNNNEDEAIAFLIRYDSEYSEVMNKYVHAEWNYNTNITEETSAEMIAAGLKASIYNAKAFENASQFDPAGFSDDTKRQLSRVGSKSLSDEKMNGHVTNGHNLQFCKGKVCRNLANGTQECLSLDPDLTILMAESRNATERLWAWEEWRVEVSQKMKPLYLRYVELKNELAQLNEYSDYGDQWRQKYETPTFESDIRNIYDEMMPLYMQLHAYVRRKLFEIYGANVVDIKGPLPQHILGDMWGRFWRNLYSIAVPYPDRPSLDVTEAMQRQNYTVKKMFEIGDDFFTSMGLPGVPETFYDLSMLEKPLDGREVACHASAWDFSDGKDVRVKMCTKILYEEFLTVHHELGHVQYFMQYAHLPFVYRGGANEGFHEAVGELMSMCVATPKHLYTIGLLDELLDDRKSQINFLFQMALTSISTLPFHYLNDLWRWRVFRGEYPLENWNNEFWKLSEEIVGVRAPISRTPADLDALSLYHVATDWGMIMYYCRTILQFQFAESLCEAAGHDGPLSECDFYGSKPAGNKLSAMLEMGSSKPWPEAMEALTGEKTMNTRAIRKYFEPLESWLQVTNWLNGDTVGWSNSE